MIQKNLSFLYGKKGYSIYLAQKKGMTGGEALHRTCNKHGVSSLLVSQQELGKIDSNLVSDAVIGGLYFPNDVHIDSKAFVLALANYLKSQGVEIQTHTQIQSIQPLSKVQKKWNY